CGFHGRPAAVAAGVSRSFAVSRPGRLPGSLRPRVPGRGQRPPRRAGVVNGPISGKRKEENTMNLPGGAKEVNPRYKVMPIMLAAKWYPADKLTLRSCLEIAAEVSVLKRAYDDAPVSSELLLGRKQDLAFEQAVGDNPRHRHHVRFWESDKRDPDGR